MTTVEEREQEYITEAMKFIDIAFQDVIVRVTQEPTFTKPIIVWEMSFAGTDFKINGRYELVSREYTHLSAIMSVAIWRNRYGYMVFDIMEMASRMEHTDMQRNSVAEILCRFLILEAKNIMPKGQVLEHLKRRMNFAQNMDEIYFDKAGHN